MLSAEASSNTMQSAKASCNTSPSVETSGHMERVTIKLLFVVCSFILVAYD